MTTKFMRTTVISALFLLIFALGAHALDFTEIRIGDIDGFGYEGGAGVVGLLAADGLAADRDSNLKLGIGDFLPDLNGDGWVKWGSSDEFDNRLGEGVSITGTSPATKINTPKTVGQLFTDISLTTTYDAASAGNLVYNHNTGLYGPGGAFPKPPSTIPPHNQPGFVFDFTVDSADLPNGSSTPLYFNLIFGDYDVYPADVTFTYKTAPSSTQALTKQPANKDGLIQAASPSLKFSDVFTVNGAGNYDGYLEVDFIAPVEPYTAFDYVEIGVKPIKPTIPEPTTLFLMGFGILGLAGIVARQRRKDKA